VEAGEGAERETVWLNEAGTLCTKVALALWVISSHFLTPNNDRCVPQLWGISPGNLCCGPTRAFMDSCNPMP